MSGIEYLAHISIQIRLKQFGLETLAVSHMVSLVLLASLLVPDKYGLLLVVDDDVVSVWQIIDVVDVWTHISVVSF